MNLSINQVHNVLRTYSRQLQLGRAKTSPRVVNLNNLVDKVTISKQGRKVQAEEEAGPRAEKNRTATETHPEPASTK